MQYFAKAYGDFRQFHHIIWLDVVVLGSGPCSATLLSGSSGELSSHLHPLQSFSAYDQTAGPAGMHSNSLRILICSTRVKASDLGV